MATTRTPDNNCYVDLHIYTNADAMTGNNEHIYNSLKHNNTTTPGILHRQALQKCGIFKNSKLLACLVVCTILVFSACSLSVGYVVGKEDCKRHKIHRTSHQDRASFVTTNRESSSTTTESVTSGSVTAFSSFETNADVTTIVSTEITTDRRSTIKPNLNGKKFRLYRQSDQKHWHYDESVQKFVSGIWQPLDVFTVFKFTELSDGSFKIQSVPRNVYLFDGYGVEGARWPYLNGVDNTDDDHMRFLVTMETKELCRIRTKATGRYLRMDLDLHVSSISNIKDNDSLFRLSEVK